ncbi:SNF2-related protein [Desulfovibrio sp. X2]|uniref:DEAD/DEAH box helicase n=1 Tax=Desulfovibrio sp. X2 TaxID=941449 RepID=UPI0003588510|nr:DEAD/DEAH box helicase [Desulfovibrio sp. X2]EPR43454.1 SNF2-related protein [Desulfovibrio sp. X2]
MGIRLEWRREGEAVRFFCSEEDAPLPLAAWWRASAELPNGRAAALGTLLGLVDEERATTDDGGTSVVVPDAALAVLEPWQLAGLGLPGPAPVRLAVVARGTLSSPSFSLEYGFVYDNGIPASGAIRDGVFLRHGAREHLLPEPLYTIVQRIDAYRRDPIRDMDERFLWWSRLADMLPSDVGLEGFLRQVHAVRPEAFSLDFVAAPGGLSVLPRFVRAVESEDGNAAHEDVLPAVVGASFQERFARQQEPGGRYVLGQGWFVVLPPAVRTALEVVHRVNGESEERKREFLRNPRAAIRSRLEDVYGEVTDEVVASIFQETPLFLSERVRYLGVWLPKAELYVKPPAGQWLPDEAPPQSLLMPIGPAGTLIEVAPADLDDLAVRIDDARDAGKTTVTFKGQEVAASAQSARVVSKALRMFGSGGEPEPEPDEPSPRQDVPIIFDHIEELGIHLEAGGLRPEAEAQPSLHDGVRLHEHQQQGLAWLQEHWRHASPGALLADDMGLGKTLQTLAFLSWIRNQQQAGMAEARPFLIVAPTGLLRNWEEEIAKFLIPGALGQLIRAHGSELRGLVGRGARAAAFELGHGGVVLTTYETLRDKIITFTGVHWGAAVFDEAQKIKNPRAMSTDMAKSIKAEFTLTLTGTPVENTLVDVWCIMDAAHPGRLDSLRTFMRQYMPEGGPDERALRDLQAELARPAAFPSLLRRNKETHWAERPEKRQEIERIPMPPEQAAAYQNVIVSAMQHADGPGAVLKALHSIRTVSLHPYMSSWDGAAPDAFVNASARLQGMFRLLSRIKEQGEKALIFIESKEMQQVLVELLRLRLGCGPVLVINGEVSGALRQQRVHEFQARKGFDAILLSPRAAGVGLNLTAATHVIHLSRWWNPAVEDQCTDRAYRIGQHRAVTVHYPMAIHPELGEASFDVKLHELLERKRRLSHGLLGSPLATADDLAGLLHAVVEPDGEPTA